MHADGQFPNAPYFNFNDGQRHLNNNVVNNPNDHYGSASAFSPKSLLKKSILYGMLLLLAACLDPTAKLSAYLIYRTFQGDILFVINDLGILRKPHEHPQHVQLEAGLFQNMDFLGLGKLACLQQRLQEIKYQLLATLPRTIAVLLWYDRAPAIKGLV